MKWEYNILILVLIAVVCIAGCSSTSSLNPEGTGNTGISPVGGKYTDLTPDQAKTLVETENNLVIVDVSSYYDDGHILSAISIPLETLDNVISSIDKTQPYLVYSDNDIQSTTAASTFVSSGFPRVYRLQGGYQAWVDAGYPVDP